MKPGFSKGIQTTIINLATSYNGKFKGLSKQKTNLKESKKFFPMQIQKD